MMILEILFSVARTSQNSSLAYFSRMLRHSASSEPKHTALANQALAVAGRLRLASNVCRGKCEGQVALCQQLWSRKQPLEMSTQSKKALMHAQHPHTVMCDNP
jgi:hypothetical protein